MNRRPFLYGIGIGIALGLLLALATSTLLNRLPGSNIVNFGFATFGFGILALEIFAAAVSLLLGVVFLVRRRWKPAGMGLAFAATVVAWWARVFLY
jgi:hypothetical protein